MTNFNRNKTLAALALATATFAAPAIASAQSYNNAGYQYNECKKKDKDNQLVGGLLGAVAGGVIGSQVAGRGERTELSVLGAVIGGAAGVGIADDNRNCRKEVQRTTSRTYGTQSTYGSNRSYNRGYTQPSRTYGSTQRRQGYTTVGHRKHRGYNKSYNRGYQTEFGTFYNSWEVRQRIEQLKAEDRPLKARQKYERSRWIDRRRAELTYEIKSLKKIEDRLEKNERRGYRSY